MLITGTFLDKISWDIPHQNRGEKEWSEILSAIQGSVDIVAFQDGHCEYNELAEYLRIYREHFNI